MVRIPFKFFKDMAARLAKEHDGETAGDAAVDAAGDAVQNGVLAHIGKQAFGPAIGVAANAFELLGQTALKQMVDAARETARLEKVKKERLKNMSPAERRRLERLERSGLVNNNTPDGFGESWDVEARRAEIVERHKQQRIAKRAVLGAASISIAGKALRDTARGTTATAAGGAAMWAVAAAGLLTGPISLAVVGGAAFVATAFAAHKLIHFATDSKDDLLSPLFDYAVTSMLYKSVLLKKDGESSAMRQMKDRYAKVGRGLATIPQRLLPGLFKAKTATPALPPQSTRRQIGARFAGLPQPVKKAAPALRRRRQQGLTGGAPA